MLTQPIGIINLEFPPLQPGEELPPGKPPRKDLRDFINLWRGRGLSNQEIFAKFAALPVEYVTPDPLAKERAVLSDLGIDVLGELANDGGRPLPLCFTHDNLKFVPLVGNATLRLADAIQAFGDPIKRKVVNSDPRPGEYTLDTLRNSIASVAGKTPIDSLDSLRGPGVWPRKGNQGETASGVVLVGPKEAARWNGGKFERFVAPRDGGLLLNIGCHHRWCDFGRLANEVERMTPAEAERALNDAAALFGRWRWERRTAPSLVAALVACSLVQSCWKFRPQIGIHGKTNVGKSFFFDCLREVFGGDSACVQISKPTEAALRQKIAGSSLPAIVDEMEACRERPAIYEMVRAASRGGVVPKGSPSGRTKDYWLHHIFWLGATELGIVRAPDVNRFICLKLDRALPGQHGKLKLPTEAEARDLGCRLLALAIRHVEAAAALAVSLKCEIEGYDNRLVEAYAVPAALKALAIGTPDDAMLFLDTWLRDTVDLDSKVSDEEDALDALLAAVIRLPGGNASTVAELIESGETAILETYGVGVRDGRIFIDPKSVLNIMPEWKGKNVGQVFLNISGAEKIRHRIAGRQPRGILLPLESTPAGQPLK